MSTTIETAATKSAFRSESQGGNGGVAFTDESTAKSGPITKIALRHANEIDQIEVFYGGRTAGKHGGGGGTPAMFILQP